MIPAGCDCAADGYCSRYRRDMGGRFREICQGINVDLGTAAAFREQWQREAGTQQTVPPTNSPTKLLLITDQMPGDTVAMTAAVYSLHRSHPGKYLTAVQSPYPDVWRYNPDVVPAFTIPDAKPLQMHYPAIHLSNERGIHFMQGWTEFLGAALGIHIPLMTNRPHLYFPNPEPLIEDYWIICSGGKRDFTTKLWGHDNYQRVVYSLRSDVRFLQVGSATDDHPRLKGAVDKVGKTSLRELFNLVRCARGVVCGISLLMHVAAALGKPCIVIAGGREPVQWNAYPKQQYLHTIGALPCKSVQGHEGQACWRSRTVPLNDGSLYDKDTCEQPIGNEPECMRMIAPETVASLVMRYNRQHNEMLTLQH